MSLFPFYTLRENQKTMYFLFVFRRNKKGSLARNAPIHFIPMVPFHVFFPSTFVCSCFFPKIQFLYCLLSQWWTPKIKFLKIRSLDRLKMHLRNFSLQKHYLYIVDKHFSREYYGLVINVYEIASHKLVPMVQSIRWMVNKHDALKLCWFLSPD